ncbi:MAG: hypothetical protein QOD75_1626 [Blastocatellia bacterium]|nr:hypothetical protein [Blastocatellia bacterium]
MRTVEACGPFSLNAIFTYSKHPDMPLDAFVKGNIGVLQPSYARSYLFAAYRQVSGLKFDQEEQSALLELWKDRLDDSGGPSDDEAVKPWSDARATIPGIPAPPQIGIYRNREKPNDYESYLNCQGDAFATAANTLNERKQRYGADSAEIRDWVQAQDAVFSNCSAGQNIPSPAALTAPSWLKSDRAYQIAAGNFYAARFAEAKDQFAAIAADGTSTWSQTAAYMVARTSLRQAGLGKEDERQAALTEAEAKLQGILRDNRLSAQHHAAYRLLSLVRLRLRPEEKLHELSQSILKRNAGETLKQDLWDYTILLDKFLGDSEEGAKPNNLSVAILADDVTDWIVTFENGKPVALDHAMERFTKTSSLPWLIAALAKVEAKDPRAASLIDAAAHVDRRSPAFASATYHRVRLLMDSGKEAAAREILDQFLGGDRKQIPPSALNLFLGERMLLARTLSDFLRDAPRPPAGVSYDEDGRELPADADETGRPKDETTLFDQDAITLMNEGIPLVTLVAAASSTALPPHLRRDVTQAAWLRAALLDRREEANRLTPLLAGLYPQLRELLDVYGKESATESRKSVAIFIALRFPGLRPIVTAGVGRSIPLDEVDSYRDNWWCLAGSNGPNSNPDEPGEPASKRPRRQLPIFLSTAEHTAAATEMTRLNVLGSGPNYLSRMAIEWANREPADPRVPEALHLAVTATRRGCTDKETGRWSKAAFDLLHRKYPRSPWTAKTKYWFKD